ncbi:MAG: FkbM family methyltransferase [Pseudomonadota bacterium]
MAQPEFGTYAPSFWVKVLLGLSQNTLLGRGKARRWMSARLQKAHQGPLDAHLWRQPARIHVGANNNELKALLNPASFNKAELQTLRAHLPRRGGVFVDIGANVGMMSLAARAHLETGTIVSIEPQPVMFERLAFNLVDAGEQNGVTHKLVQAAIGPTVGEANLAIPSQPGMATLAEAASSVGQTVTVAVLPLEKVCRDQAVDAIDVLKIDVEGYEDQALLPFFESAPRTLWPRVIIMEHCHSQRWSSDVIAALLGEGYAQLRRDRQNTCLELVKS